MTIKIQGDKITFPDDSEQTTAYNGSSGSSIWTTINDGGQDIATTDFPIQVPNMNPTSSLDKDCVLISDLGQLYKADRNTFDQDITVNGDIQVKGGTIDLRDYKGGSTTATIKNEAPSGQIDFEAQGSVRMSVKPGGVTTTQDMTVNGIRVGMGGGATAQPESTVLGVDVLAANVSGSGNTGIGSNALRRNTSGYSNTAIGRNALTFVVEGANNTGVGSHALGACTGNNNTSIGESAGSATITGNNNTLLGSGSQPSSADVSNEVTIGNGGVTKVRMGNGTVIGGGASVTFDNTVTATIRASNNVSGVSRTAVGVYEISFIRPMSNDAYTCVASHGATDGASQLRAVVASYYLDKTKCRVTVTAPDTGSNYEGNDRIVNLIVMDN